MQNSSSTTITLDMIAVPEGSFTMGTRYSAEETAEGEETPPHRVWLSAYQMQRTPVTVRQWRSFVADAHYDWPSEVWLGSVREYVRDGEPGPDHPITSVSWHDCSAFIEWLQRTKHAAYALPTEAQWEKACRGSEGQCYPWTRTQPNWDQEQGAAGRDRLALRPVGVRPDRASPYGCLDMCDNIYEWCADWYDDVAYEKRTAEELTRNPLGQRG